MVNSPLAYTLIAHVLRLASRGTFNLPPSRVDVYQKDQLYDLRKVIIHFNKLHITYCNLLDFIGGITKQKRARFKVRIPYFPDVFILDEITVQSPEIIPDDAFVWVVSKWGQARWRKALKADNISSSDTWLVKEVKHSNLITNLIVEEVV